jgi:molybdopterin converting factor small subunit
MTMQIRLKLMGILRAKAPEGNLLDIPDGASIEDVMQTLDIPTTHVHLAMIDGQHQRDRTTALAENQELMLMPPVGGG